MSKKIINQADDVVSEMMEGLLQLMTVIMRRLAT